MDAASIAAAVLAFNCERGCLNDVRNKLLHKKYMPNYKNGFALRNYGVAKTYIYKNITDIIYVDNWKTGSGDELALLLQFLLTARHWLKQSNTKFDIYGDTSRFKTFIVGISINIGAQNSVLSLLIFF